MDLFLVELAVTDWPASVAWYRDRLGLAVELLDEANNYALLTAGAGRVGVLVFARTAPPEGKKTT